MGFGWTQTNWQLTGKDLNEGQQKTNAVSSEVDGLNQQI